MEQFLVAAIVTALIISSLVFARPSRESTEVRIKTFAKNAGIDINSRYVRFVILFIVLIQSIYLFIFGFGLLHDKRHPIFSFFEFLHGSFFEHLMMGVFFGVILPFWLVAIYRHEPKEKWPAALYLETAVVLAVFVFGVFDAFEPLWTRLTSVPTPWGSITLSPGATEAKAPGKPDRGLYASRGGVSSALSPPVPGIDAVELMGSYVRREIEIAKLTSAQVAPVPAATEDMELLADTLDQTFGALASCHRFFNTTTGEVDYTKHHLSSLLPPFSRLLSDHARFDYVIGDPDHANYKNLATSYLKISSELLTWVYDDFRADAQSDERNRQCGALALLPCQLLQNRPEGGWASAYCKRVCQDSTCKGVNSKYDEHVQSPERTGLSTQPELVDALVEKFRKAWCKGEVAKDDALSNDRKLELCPYHILLYAAISSAAGEPWVGLKRVVDWLNGHPERQDGKLDIRNWRRVRMLSFAATQLDQTDDKSDAIVNLRIIISYKLMSLIRSMPITTTGLDILRSTKMPPTYSDESDLEGAPLFERTCPPRGDADQQVKFAVTYLTNAFTYVDLAEQQSEDWKTYTSRVSEIMHGMHLDLSCVYLGFEYNDNNLLLRRDLWQAEIRRLEARRLLLEIQNNKPLLSADERRTMLIKGLRMLEAGQDILTPHSNHIGKKLNDIGDYASSANPPTDLEDNVLKTLKQISGLKSEFAAQAKSE